jgi:hypothetical protein
MSIRNVVLRNLPTDLKDYVHALFLPHSFNHDSGPVVLYKSVTQFPQDINNFYWRLWFHAVSFLHATAPRFFFSKAQPLVFSFSLLPVQQNSEELDMFLKVIEDYAGKHKRNTKTHLIFDKIRPMCSEDWTNRLKEYQATFHGKLKSNEERLLEICIKICIDWTK